MAHARRSWLRDNGLTLVLLALFLVSILGQVFAGHAAENRERLQEGLSAQSLGLYVASGAFLSSVFENWESEFLQMWAYVMLTAYLFQRGSPESRDPDHEEVRPGEEPGALRTLGDRIYAHSLGIALLGLFVTSFLLHWANSARHAGEKAMQLGEPAPTLIQYLGEPQLWFESFQNWQSEFLSAAILIALGIFLRERKSSESKAVGDPDAKTGA
ncbi:MAG TPA: DUF6766 family protein [Hyphomonadaceae bacterium]|nr:DUF6766 family protein [Hyphomonadaceae bacterium]